MSCEAFAKAWQMQGPVLIDCRIDPDDFVYPMIPPNKSFDELMLPEKAQA